MTEKRWIRLAQVTVVVVFSLWFWTTTEIAPPVEQTANASTLNIPNTFSSGGVIFASQMNANFTAVKNVVNALDDQNVTNASITGSTKLIDGTVTLSKMAPDSVDSSKIVADTIVAADIATGGVATAEILDGTILVGDIADNAVTEPKIDIASAPATGSELFYNGTKLDYRVDDTVSTTCVQVLSSRLKINAVPAGPYYSSFTERSTDDNTNESITAEWTSPKSVTVGNLRVRMGAIAVGTWTFSVRPSGGSDILTCSIPALGTTCSDSSTFTTYGDNVASLIVKASQTSVVASTTYVAFLCTSPF